MGPTDQAVPPSASPAGQPRWSEVLRALREARGVTQDGWAARIGVSRKTVQRWERGERAPDPGAEATIVAYCREAGLFRAFDRGPLGGVTLTAESLQELLAEARWRVAGAAPAAPPAAEPPPARGASGPTNLPTMLTSFVGRERELEAVRRVQAGTRLLTLAGAGGSGKTRLSLAIAGELLWAYPHGIWLVELAALANPELTAETVASALGVRPPQPQPPEGRQHTEALVDYLKPRNLLLVLDSCEHLLEACAHLAEALLRACPHLEIVTTSREPLGVSGETVWRVPPLAPADATRLFLDRARLYQPDFKETEANHAAIDEICLRLDGIPLAIELAAARVKVLSPQQIAARLADRFRLLTGGSQTALPRHQTLRAALDWSYDLLTDDEQALLRRLAVFAGGFTLEAAEVVGRPNPRRIRSDAPFPRREGGALRLAMAPDLGTPPLVGEGPARSEGDGRSASADVLDLLAQLVDKSLVSAEAQDGAVRYRLLETVRQYAGEKLSEVGEDEAVRGRHLEWCTALVEAARAALHGPGERGWLTRLEQEHDNLRAALRWALDHEQSGAALNLAAMLPRFWELRAHLSEGRQWLDQALAAGVDAPPALRARAMYGAGGLAYMQGDYAVAGTLYERALVLQRSVGDRQGIADSQTSLGTIALRLGDHAAARAHLEAGYALHVEIGYKPGIANTRATLGMLALRQGDYAAAVARYEASLALYRELGDKDGMADALDDLATVAGEQGEHDRQQALLEEAAALYDEMGNTAGTAMVLSNLGMGVWAQGDIDRANALLGSSLTLYRELGDRRGIARLLAHLGMVALSQREYTRAEGLCRESLTIYRELRDVWVTGRYLPILAGAARGQGQIERAARLYAAAAAVRGRFGTALPPIIQQSHDRAVAAVRATLGDDAFASAWAAGEAMPAETAIDYALSGNGAA